MLAIILWLGNIQFAEDDSGNSVISDTNVTDFVAYLMEVDPAVVQKTMTIKVVETQRGGRRGSVYDVPLNPAQAGSGRDALTKAIYNNLFEWIVSKVNVSMKPRGTIAQLIGILVWHLPSICPHHLNFDLAHRISSVSRSSRSEILHTYSLYSLNLDLRTTHSNNCASITSTRSYNRSSSNSPSRLNRRNTSGNRSSGLQSNTSTTRSCAT